MAEEIENKETVKTGPEPEDKTKEAAPSAAVSEEGKGPLPSEEENLPWNKDKRFQEFNKQRKELIESHEKVKEIMEANGLDSMEELIDLVESGKKVIGKISDPEDIDELIAKAKRHDDWVEYYAKKAEQEKREAETSEETIARQDKEIAALKSRDAQIKAIKENEELLKGFTGHVESAIEEVLKDLPKDQKGFITEFFGVNNPFAVIDIGDKRAVRKMVIEGKKKLESFKNQVIKDYIAGKDEIPHVTHTGESTTEAPVRITLKTARLALHEKWKPFG